jgi:hypothetical protein
MGDGWIMNANPPNDNALAEFATLRALTAKAGRDPNAVGIEVWTSAGAGSAVDWKAEAKFWKAAGATHLTLTNTFQRRHHRRIAGKTVKDHLEAQRRYRDAVADVL